MLSIATLHCSSFLKPLTSSSHRDYFRKYLFFSSRSTFFRSFPGDLMCSPNISSRKVCLFAEQISFFQELCLCVPLTDTYFPGTLFLANEQIPFFQEHFYSYRTDTNFPGALLLATEQITIFQEHLFLFFLLFCSGLPFDTLPCR